MIYVAIRIIQHFSNESKVMSNNGCLMLRVDTQKVPQTYSILDEDLYVPSETGGKYGRETEPHVTVLYGLDVNSVSHQDIRDFIKENVKSPVKFKLKNISLFENELFDVVKWDVESEKLVELNKKLKERFNYTNAYDEYKPHMTVAYVKKGMGSNYTAKTKTYTLESDSFFYSDDTYTTNILARDGIKNYHTPTLEAFTQI